GIPSSPTPPALPPCWTVSPITPTSPSSRALPIASAKANWRPPPARRKPKGLPMPSDPDSYRRALTDLYLRLPDTPRRLSRFDLRLVRQLCDRQIPLTVVETAFLLASARRIHRPADA